MKKFIFVYILAILAILTSCGKKVERQTTTFISKDSTFVYAFVGNDSLYITNNKGGDTIEVYKLELTFNTKTAWFYDAYACVIDDGMKASNYKTCDIVLFQDPMGTHYEYVIQFDHEEQIPIMKRK